VTFDALLPYLAGPGSAVICLLIIIAGAYKIAVNHLVPMGKIAVDRHMAELERANQRHENAVAAHMAHIVKMGDRYDRLAIQHANEHGAILEAIERVSDRLEAAK
jgi:hypothetical protein